MTGEGGSKDVIGGRGGRPHLVREVGPRTLRCEQGTSGRLLLGHLREDVGMEATVTSSQRAQPSSSAAAKTSQEIFFFLQETQCTERTQVYLCFLKTEGVSHRSSVKFNESSFINAWE